MSGAVGRLADAAAQTGGGMLYCVSVTGVTGGAAALKSDLEPFMARVRAAAGDVPLAVGFGISTPEGVKETAALADGVVVGSAIIRSLDASADFAAPKRAGARCSGGGKALPRGGGARLRARRFE